MSRSSADPPIPAAVRRDPGIVIFLIDEYLSVDLVAVAGRAGHEAYHVAHIGDAGWKDWNVLHYARDRDFVFVTNNAIFGVSMRRRRSMPGSSSCSRRSAAICRGGCFARRSTNWG